MATNASTPVSNPITAPSPDSTGPFNIGFAYIKQEDVKVTVNGDLKNINTDYTFSSATQITFNSAVSSGSTILFVRDTAIDQKTVDFVDGSVLTEADLDNNTNQILFAQQELVNDYVKRDGSLTVTGNLVFEGATDNTNETTLAITDPTADRTITIPDVTGTIVTTGDTDTVSTAMLRNDIDISTTGSITSGSLTVNGNVTLGINFLNTIDFKGSINSHFDPTFDDTYSLGSQAFEWKDLFIDGTANIDSLVADTADINGGSIDGATIGSSSASTGVFTTISASGNVDFNGDLDVEGTTRLFGNVQIGNNPTGDSLTITSKITSNLKPDFGSTYNLGSATQPWNDIYVDNIKGDAIVTNTTSTSDTQVYSAKYSDERYYNVSTASDIVSGNTWEESGTKLATTDAIDARIRDLVDDVGGFVPVANLQSFPDKHPDINNPPGPGTLLSVKLNNTLNDIDNDGQFEIPNATLNDNNTVTITDVGVGARFEQGFGIIVETTATEHEYKFHRYVPKATEVTTVAGNIQDINAVAGQIANNNLQDVASVKNNIAALNVTVRGQISTITTSTNLTALQNAATNATAATNAKNAAEAAQSAAETAETNAEAAKTAAEAAFDNFDDRYLGAKSTDPTLDNDGNALINGALYFNTSLNVIKVYDGAAWNQITPTDAQQTNIDATVLNETNINTVATNINDINNASANATTATEQAAIATTQASSASSNATLVQNLSDNFHGVYLGALTGDPAGDSLGDFVNAGDIYFDTTIKKFKVFNGSSFDIVGFVSRNFFASPQVANLGVFKKYAVLTDTKAAPNSGGSFLKNFWRVRDINTEQFDDDNITSISNNQFTLQAGTYFIKASALSSNVGDNQLRIYNATDSSELARGTVCQSIIDGANFTATVQARVTITAAKAFEIQHIASQDQSIYGFGVGLVGSGNFSTLTNNEDQDFLTVEIYKESDSNTTDIILGFDLVYPAATAGNNNVDFGELPDINTTSGFADENISSGKLVSLAEGSNTTPFDFGSI